MNRISYARHRFPSPINERAIWLYFRFPLSFRDVEEMLAERGIDVGYETVRRWILKFGPAIVADVRSLRVQASGTRYIDEVFVRTAGRRRYLWCAVNDEGEVLEVRDQTRRNKRAALKLIRKFLKKQGYVPDVIVTDKLGSYTVAFREFGLAHFHVTGGRLNNRAKVSHPLPGNGLFTNHEKRPTRLRERRMGRLKSLGSMQRHLISRPTLRQTRASAYVAWNGIVTA